MRDLDFVEEEDLLCESRSPPVPLLDVEEDPPCPFNRLKADVVVLSR